MKKIFLMIALMTTVITANAQLLFTTTKVNPYCSGTCNGTASVFVSGGASPYSYQWSNGNSSGRLTMQCAGIYTVTVTDANALTKSTSITLTAPAPIGFTLSVDSSSAEVSGVSGGTAPYTYLWSTGETTPAVTGLQPGSYTITITDAKGCYRSHPFTN